VEVDRIEAAFKNGLLTVTLPKAAEAKARQVAIKTD
jgi:HSP20 family molecular chaperone IbpA